MVDPGIVELARLRARCRSGGARKARTRADLSLREVAVVIGVSPTTIMRWEDGGRPRGDAALRYNELLDDLEATQ